MEASECVSSLNVWLPVEQHKFHQRRQSFRKEPDWCRTASERVSTEDSRQETAKTTHRQVTDEPAELLSDLLALKPPPRLRSYTNI